VLGVTDSEHGIGKGPKDPDWYRSIISPEISWVYANKTHRRLLEGDSKPGISSSVSRRRTLVVRIAANPGTLASWTFTDPKEAQREPFPGDSFGL
jgi:hypothetical protein